MKKVLIKSKKTETVEYAEKMSKGNQVCFNRGPVSNTSQGVCQQHFNRCWGVLFEEIWVVGQAFCRLNVLSVAK